MKLQIFSMKAVGLRELKNRLGRYVEEVRRGDVILVTDRGEVVAELRPPGHVGSAPAGLARMADRGDLVLGLPHDPTAYRRLGPCAPPGTAKALLDEDRDE
jgi:antitoxin (DNA-binding transcriptional repressor) of toxin-antitoxin stability system